VDGTEGGAAEKQRLRAELLDARRARSADALRRARAAVCRHVLDRVGGVSCAAAYVPLRSEPGSVELLAGLRERGIRVLVPVTLPDRDLDWTEWGARADEQRLGVSAIAEADLVIVPALAVAADGTRLGRGGGSYDRALARCTSAATVAALLFDGEVLHHLPREPWDRPVGHAVTPSGWRPLGRNAGVPLAR
jgi:5-formyltetrahydrofolate cyclo-ligase